MSRDWGDDYWEDRGRPRRGWEDDPYDDLPTFRTEPSGAVTSVAVACFIWAGLFIVISGCLGLCFLAVMGPGGPPRGAAVGVLGGQESILAIRCLAFFA